MESYSSLKTSVAKVETEKRQYENQVNIFRHEKLLLEKNIREEQEEKTYLREQVHNLQQLLANAEDDKESR